MEAIVHFYDFANDVSFTKFAGEVGYHYVGPEKGIFFENDPVLVVSAMWPERENLEAFNDESFRLSIFYEFWENSEWVKRMPYKLGDKKIFTNVGSSAKYRVYIEIEKVEKENE